MSTSIFSVSSSVSRTTSASAFQRRERGGSKTKRPPDDGFISAYTLNCDAAGLKTYPTIVASTIEPATWLTAAYEKRSIMTKSSTLRGTHSSTENKSPMETGRSHHSMKTLPKSKKPKADNEIYALYNDPDKEGCIAALIYKHFPMEDTIMGVLQKTLIKFSTLKTLRLEFCRLTPDQLKAVKFILMKCDNIVELSLDSNPLSNQNYYILLKDTKLISLSLKFCKIDNIGAVKLASYLHYPYSQALIILDLSCNCIGDEGCESLANALRTNRSLTHLSLASNCITSIGCQKLMEVLRRFDLRHDEVLLKRKLNMDYLLRCKMAHHQSAQMLLGSGLETASQDSMKRSSSKIEKRKSSLTKNKKDKSSVASGSTLRNLKRSKSITASISSFNLLVEKDLHPYMHECVHEDKKVFCRGNTKLEYLNLSYNNINYSDASEIEATLMYQISLLSDSGVIERIVKLVLDENPFIQTVDCRLITELTSVNTLPQQSSNSMRRLTRRPSSQSR